MATDTVLPPDPQGRHALLADRRRLKMARSAHAYVRGSTRQFYAWLRSSTRTEVPEGPSVWICGDCHIGNLGPVSDMDGRVEVQIRDLDQTVIGNPAHDLIRLSLSLAMAARSSDLPGVTTLRMIEEAMAGYEQALAFGDGELPRLEEPQAVRLAMRRALGRRWPDLAAERIRDTKPEIPLGKKFLELSGDERRQMESLFETEAVRGLISRMERRSSEDRIALIDAAYWVKGCSSLGRLRYAALVAVGEGKKSRSALIDVKEAVTAAAPACASCEMPADAAERVVEGARCLAPHLGDRMLAIQFLGKPVVVRELAPQDLKLEFETLGRDEAMSAARYLAAVVGVAHGRQMDAATRLGWLEALKRSRPSDMEAPSWLWSSVVELISQHEAAYLEHCRRYALEDPSTREAA